jgi:hypothetical protein
MKLITFDSIQAYSLWTHKILITFLYETNIQCMKLITFLHVIGWGAAAGALVGSNHHVAGSRRGGGGAPGGAGNTVAGA